MRTYIKEKAREQGKTIKEVFDHAGISQQTLDNWESGRNLSTPKKMKKISDFLGCTLEDLFKKNT